MSASATSLPDLICITDLSLRTPALGVDLWQRSAKSQPLFLSLWIQTSVLAEASTDSLLSSSLNYGSVTKAIEAFVSQLAPAADEDGLPLETLAERLAQVVLFQANAPNVRLELTRPRALLSAESIGVQVSRTTADYESEPDSRGIYSLKQASQALASDKFFVRQLRRSIIIGINPCEREDEQEVIVDLEFWNDDMMLRPWNGARLGWEEWRPVIKQLEAHLSSSGPLTIEHLTTSLSQRILTPPDTNAASPNWNVTRTSVRVSKPCALMYAKYPSVQVTRSRSDFFNADGKLKSAFTRGVATSSGAASSVTSTNASTTPTELGSSSEASGSVHQVVLGVGTNMGERVANISKALKELEQIDPAVGKVRIVATSFLYESEAMYVEDQAKFLNAAVKIETTLAPLPLLGALKSIEDSLGRLKTIRNGPRIIDLDILFYDDLLFDSRDQPGADSTDERWLKIPHASIAEREFVLRPLVDLIPDLPHPALPSSTPSSLLATLLETTPSSLVRVVPLTASLTHSVAPSAPTLIMSILNATPDSFSDGGSNPTLATALAHLDSGADILDVGGMSTRPGAADVSPTEEVARVVPLIQAIRAHPTRGAVPISVDTFRPDVARAAVEAGANIINDVRGGEEPGMLAVMAELDCPVVLMHSRGAIGGSSTYVDGDVVRGVREELEQRVDAALAAGVKRWNIITDPGIGFAKTGGDNLILLRRMDEVLGPGTKLGEYPSLVGLSRKRFIGTLTGKDVASERVLGTAAAVTASIQGGARIVRVHDVEEMRDVVKVADGIYRA